MAAPKRYPERFILRIAGTAGAAAAVAVFGSACSSGGPKPISYRTPETAVDHACHPAQIMQVRPAGTLTVTWQTKDQAPGVGWSASIKKTAAGRYFVVKCKASGVTHA